MSLRAPMALSLLTAMFAGGTGGCESNKTTSVKPSSSADALILEDPALPGLGEGSGALMGTLRAAVLAKGPDYVPRTEHLNPDGSPKFTNRLILETSPYLLQHAHNPVNWYPWGDAAFERARKEGKPVLLSVGYSTCHWCHVMERESFEDLEIAQFMNEHFVAIKVDREERPDVDDIYMTAVQMLTGRGGWPMTVLLTPDRQPFFGGTYFPARDGDRGTNKGFLTILGELKAKYATDPTAVVAEAKALSERIASSGKPRPASGMPTAAPIVSVAQESAQTFDAKWGGFGRAPKFPTPSRLTLLLRYFRHTGDNHARDMVVHTLKKMAAGGIHDQVGGGFHRYSTDAKWLVPHFEKMLYDNAQLAVVYLEAFQITKDPALRTTAEKILDYVAKEMTNERGGFYSATDADSPTPSGHDEEGYYFTWTPAELDAALGAEAAKIVATTYGVTAAGNFEGRNILHLERSLGEVATSMSMSVKELSEQLDQAKAKLYAVRAERPAPIRDDKVLTSWNGLMISAFARGAFVLARPDYLARAEKAATFLLDEMRDTGGRLYRTHMNGSARHPAYLDDYAFTIQALLDLYEASANPKWLKQARSLQKVLDTQYLDVHSGGYYMTAGDHEKLLSRDKPSYDGAEPSGNAIAILNLLRLHEFTQDADYRKNAERGLTAFSGNLTSRPSGMTMMLTALDYALDAPREVLLVRPTGTEDTKLDQVARETFLPNRIIVRVEEGAELAAHQAIIPLLSDKRALRGKATAFVCTQGHCELPTSDPATFLQQLNKTEPLVEGQALPTLSPP